MGIKVETTSRTRQPYREEEKELGEEVIQNGGEGGDS